MSQKLLKQHLLVSTASFITSLHNGQWSSGGKSPTDRVDGNPSISFSKASLFSKTVEINFMMAGDRKNGKQSSVTHSFGFRTATAPLGKAYEPSGVAMSMDFGIPVGGLTFLMS